MPDIQVASLVSKCYSGESNAYPGDPSFELSLLAECMSAIHWGSHVEVPNTISKRCSNGSFLESSPPTAEAQVRFPVGSCQTSTQILSPLSELKSQISRGVKVSSGMRLPMLHKLSILGHEVSSHPFSLTIIRSKVSGQSLQKKVLSA